MKRQTKALLSGWAAGMLLGLFIAGFVCWALWIAAGL